MNKFIVIVLLILLGCSKDIPEPSIKPTSWQTEHVLEEAGHLDTTAVIYDWYVKDFLISGCDTFYGEPIMYAVGLNWPDSMWTTLGIFCWQSESMVICEDYIEASATDINVYLHSGPGRIDTVIWSSNSPDLIVDTIWREELYPDYDYDDLEPNVLQFRSFRDTVKVRIHAIGINRDNMQ